MLCEGKYHGGDVYSDYILNTYNYGNSKLHARADQGNPGLGK